MHLRDFRSGKNSHQATTSTWIAPLKTKPTLTARPRPSTADEKKLRNNIVRRPVMFSLGRREYTQIWEVGCAVYNAHAHSNLSQHPWTELGQVNNYRNGEQCADLICEGNGLSNTNSCQGILHGITQILPNAKQTDFVPINILYRQERQKPGFVCHLKCWEYLFMKSDSRGRY